MKDAGFPLSTAYFNLLSGMTYQSKPVAVYSLMAPAGAAAPYVIIGPWQQQSSNTKSTFGQTGEINLDVVTRFTGAVSKKIASEIADLVTARICPAMNQSGLSVQGFRQVVTSIVKVQDMPQMGTEQTIVRKIITVSHTLNQL